MDIKIETTETVGDIVSTTAISVVDYQVDITVDDLFNRFKNLAGITDKPLHNATITEIKKT